MLARSVFLKSECKSTNYFPFHQIFREKSFKKVVILTRIHISRRSRGQNSLYYTCTRLRGRGRTHTSALIYAYYNKIQSRLTSTSIHFLSLSTRDSPQLKTENSIPYIFWRSSKDCVATAIKSSSDRQNILWRSPKDCVTYTIVMTQFCHLFGYILQALTPRTHRHKDIGSGIYRKPSTILQSAY